MASICLSSVYLTHLPTIFICSLLHIIIHAWFYGSMLWATDQNGQKWEMYIAFHCVSSFSYSKASTQEAIMNNPWYKRHTDQTWNNRGHAHCSSSFPNMWTNIASIASLSLANPKALQSQSLCSEQKSSTCRHGSFLNAEVGTDAGRNSKQMQDIVKCVILWSYFVRFFKSFLCDVFLQDRVTDWSGQPRNSHKWSSGKWVRSGLNQGWMVSSNRLCGLLTLITFVFWSVIFNFRGWIYSCQQDVP